MGRSGERRAILKGLAALAVAFLLHLLSLGPAGYAIIRADKGLAPFRSPFRPGRVAHLQYPASAADVPLHQVVERPRLQPPQSPPADTLKLSSDRNPNSYPTKAW
jgi:hypothetical protein